jgi:LysR family glycine cleavage system transcriptional activator
MNYLRKLPPLTALKTFEAVARNSSVTKAASELLVTPAAVSQQIKILEQFFGRPLFRRLPRGLAPTEEARAFLIHVSRALEGLLNASQQMRQLDHAGTVRISILPSLATRWLAPRLGRFNRRFPNLQLIIVSDINPVDFSRSDYDLAVRYGSGPYPGLRVDRLMSETLFPVCAPRLLADTTRLKAPADLMHHCLLHELVAPNRPSSEPWLTWEPWLDMWGVAADDCPNAIRMSDTAAILGAVEAGCGIAIGRSRLMADQLENGRLVPLFEHRRLSNLSYLILSPPGAADLSSVAAVRDWLLDEAEQDYQCDEDLPGAS